MALVVANGAGAGAVSRATLDFVTEMLRRTQTAKEQMVDTIAAVTKYSGGVGADVPALILWIGEKPQAPPALPGGKPGFPKSQSFKVLVLEARALETSEMFFKGGDDPSVLYLPVNMSKKEGDPVPPEALMAQMPAYEEVRSFSVMFMSAPSSELDGKKPGDVVVLSKVRANAPVPSGQYTEWSVFRNVAKINPSMAVTPSTMYEAFSSIPASFLVQPQEKYDEAANIRYMGDVFMTVQIRCKPEENPEEVARNGAVARVVVPAEHDAKDWKIQPLEKANTDYYDPYCFMRVHVVQFVGDDASGRVEQTGILGTALYKEHIERMLVATMPEWNALGPTIVRHIDAAMTGYIDLKKTADHFSAALAEGYDFAFFLRSVVFSVNLESLYRRIGVPVTEEFVRAFYKLEAPGEASAAENLVAKREAVRRMGADGATKMTCDWARANPARVEFRMVVAANEKILPKIAALSPEEGAVLVQAVASGAEIEDARLEGYSNGCTRVYYGVCIVDRPIPPKTLEERALEMARIFGKAPPPEPVAAPRLTIEDDGKAEDDVATDDGGNDVFGDGAAEPEPEAASVVAGKRKKTGKHKSGKKGKKARPAA
jgi:hypothetical protein